MKDNELDILYGQVSVELRNPFPVLGAYSKGKFKQLFDMVRRVSEGSFKGIETNHPNGLYRGFTELQQNIEQKKVQYVDILPLTVFVPSFLKPKTYLLPYMVALKDQMLLVSDVVQNAAEELEFVVDGYLGNPSRLMAPDLICTQSAKEYTLSGMQDRNVNIHATMSKYIVAGGTTSTRPFKEVFARVGDWSDANRKAYEINELFISIVRQFDAINRKVTEVNKRTAKLVHLIETDPAYAISGSVAEYLGTQIYSYAKLTELVGATLYASQVTLKAMSDTNAAVNRAVG